MMPSKTEGRIALALQAYISNQTLSLRATANTYDVPFATLRKRHLGVLSRKETTPNSRKFTNNEEQVLLQKVL
jgi:molybdate-binding protein